MSIGNIACGDKVVAEEMVGKAADAVESYLSDGIEIAMNRYNGQLDEL